METSKGQSCGLRKLKFNQHKQDMRMCTLEPSFTYSANLSPCGFFWKHLSKVSQPGAVCWVPDTFIVNDADGPAIWTYTNAQGHVEKNLNVTLKEFVAKLTAFSSPQQLVAVLKKPTYRNDAVFGNDVKLINAKALHASQFPQNKDLLVLQRYIKCSGSKAFVCRTAYRSTGKSESLILTNQHDFYSEGKNVSEAKRFLVRASAENDDFVAVRTTHGKHFDETMHYNMNIVRYFGWVLGTEFSQLICDYVKDQLGTWWLINVKAFRVSKQAIKKPQPPPKLGIDENEREHTEKERYQKTKTCKYCEKAYLESELNHKMTIRMVIATDRYLLHRGKTYRWLQRSDLANIDTHSLYEEHRVCERCYKLYMLTEELMELECRFAEKLGVPVTADSKYNLVMSAGSNYLEKQSKSREIDKLAYALPEQLELGPNSKLIIEQNCPIKNDAIISKMERFRFIIYMVSLDELTPVEPNRTYYIQYSLVSVRVRYKLDIVEGSNTISINRLRTIYLFSHDRKALNDFITSTEHITIYLVSEGIDKKDRVVWGSLNLELKDFLNDNIERREYYKMFNLKGVPWGWGLEANIGLDCSGLIDTSRTILRNINEQIYYPENADYYSCEPLPSEWINYIRGLTFDADDQQSTSNERRLTYRMISQEQTRRESREQPQNQLAIQLQKQMQSYLHRGRKKRQVTGS